MQNSKSLIPNFSHFSPASARPSLSLSFFVLIEFHPPASSSRICQIDEGERSHFRLFLCSGLRRIPQLSISLPELLSRLSYLLPCVDY
ncbi:hypothetical protein K1719_028785 [Acacia pycnantha]|nr:hypothetical protein K1719_028785 [Acacia pycnantha]